MLYVCCGTMYVDVLCSHEGVLYVLWCFLVLCVVFVGVWSVLTHRVVLVLCVLGVVCGCALGLCAWLATPWLGTSLFLPNSQLLLLPVATHCQSEGDGAAGPPSPSSLTLM